MEKLFILIRDDLPLAYQAVQGGHALAQWMLDNKQQSWNNGILVYLKVKNIDLWMHKMRTKGINFSYFVEPDIGNVITALAVQAEDKFFQKLNLIGT